MTTETPVVTLPIHTAPVKPVRKRAKRPTEQPNVVTDPPKPAIPGTPPASTPRRGHALDFAPVNSKIVRTTVGAVLATPDATTLLPSDDQAQSLPEGARIAKVAEGRYRSEQLSPAVDLPPTEHATAVQAIAAFVPYFHR